MVVAPEKNWITFDYVKGDMIAHQPHVLTKGDRVEIDHLDGVYEVYRADFYTVTIINVDTNVHLIIHIRDVKRVCV